MQIVRDVELMARLNELILRFPSELLDSTTPYTSFDHIEEIYKKGDYSALVQLNQRTKEALLDLDRKVTTYQHAVEEALSLEEAEFQF
jgi:hypothetical protein